MRNLHLKKRSQMEAFGLAIIVVLFIMGLFIIVSLRNKNTPTDPIKDYIYDEMANNYVLSIVDVHVKECYPLKTTLSDLLRPQPLL